jgi:hypothetical protein
MVMKKVTRGPMIELFESTFGPNQMTEFLWNQPIGNYFSDDEISKEFNGGQRLPNGLVKREGVKNTALDAKTIEEYKYYYREAYRRYHSIFTDVDFRQFIGRLVRAEVQMIQSRCLLEIDPKFTILKQKDKDGNLIQYIVARTSFYRESTKRDEITYYVGKTEEWGEDLDKLKDDPNFREAAINGLTKLILENMV